MSVFIFSLVTPISPGPLSAQAGPELPKQLNLRFVLCRHFSRLYRTSPLRTGGGSRAPSPRPLYLYMNVLALRGPAPHPRLRSTLPEPGSPAASGCAELSRVPRRFLLRFRWEAAVPGSAPEGAGSCPDTQERGEEGKSPPGALRDAAAARERRQRAARAEPL